MQRSCCYNYHQHVGNGESYFFLAGTGHYTENGVARTVVAGDSTWTPSGSSHGIENRGTEDLVFMALIVDNDDQRQTCKNQRKEATR